MIFTREWINLIVAEAVMKALRERYPDFTEQANVRYRMSEDEELIDTRPIDLWKPGRNRSGD